MVNWNAPIPARNLLIGILAILVVIALWQWMPRRKAAESARPAKAEEQQLPRPTSQEIATLLSEDAVAQENAARDLLQRRMTPGLASAAMAAYPRSHDAEQYITCLQARVPRQDVIDFAVSKVPPQFHTFGDVDLAQCLAGILADHATEDPNRIRDVLCRMVVTGGRARNEAIRGLKKIPAAEMPQSLMLYFDRGYPGEVMEAVEAMFAVGAVENFPQAVESAANSANRQIRGRTIYDLGQYPHHRAAVILAHLFIRDPTDREVKRAAGERERTQHDWWDALADVALDDWTPIEQRKIAVEQFGTCPDKKFVVRLEPLNHAADYGLRLYAQAAIDQMKRR